jgi:hypothetical protein
MPPNASYFSPRSTDRPTPLRRARPRPARSPPRAPDGVISMTHDLTPTIYIWSHLHAPPACSLAHVIQGGIRMASVEIASAPACSRAHSRSATSPPPAATTRCPQPRGAAPESERRCAAFSIAVMQTGRQMRSDGRLQVRAGWPGLAWAAAGLLGACGHRRRACRCRPRAMGSRARAPSAAARRGRPPRPPRWPEVLSSLEPFRSRAV